MKIPDEFLKPSMATKSSFNVLSRSELEDSPSPERLRPKASISSMKMIIGLYWEASWKSSRIRDAPTPTYFSWNWAPDTEIKGICASPASDFAKSVLPFPGGPSKIRPLGIRTLYWVYFSKLDNISTHCCNSSFTWSYPPTSLNVTGKSVITSKLSLFFPWRRLKLAKVSWSSSPSGSKKGLNPWPPSPLFWAIPWIPCGPIIMRNPPGGRRFPCGKELLWVSLNGLFSSFSSSPSNMARSRTVIFCEFKRLT